MKMRTVFYLVFGLLLGVGVGFAQGQTKTITGVVSDNNGIPLPGVNITIEGTTQGTTTDFDGKYSIDAEVGQVLHFNFVGFQEQTVTVGDGDTIDVTLQEGEALDEVVVTALGISRDERAIGYSAQSVSGDKLTASRNNNALDALSGNVAGVQITNPSSNLGGSTRILLRGVTSLTGENKPLIVIDGVPMVNNNFNSANAQRGAGGRDFGDTSFDINPDDVESIDVLKGGPAAALYGSRGANGVIMITTKQAKEGKSSISINSGITIGEVARMPRLQKRYGGGSGEFDQVDIDGTTYNVDAFGVDESWGPKYDPDRLVLQWNNFDKDAFPEDYLNPQPWVYPEHDMKTMFRHSLQTTNGVSISQSNGNTSARVSFSNMKEHGLLPNTRLRRNTLNLSLSTKLFDKLTASGDLTYVRTDGFNRPAVGYGDNSVLQKAFQWSQRQLDYKKMQDYKLPDGSQRTWNRTSVTNPSPQFSDNPYWTLYENTAQDKRNHFYGNAKLRYDILPGLYAVGTAYGDHYDLNINSHVAVGSAATSGYSVNEREFTEMNYEGRLHYDKDFGDFIDTGFFKDFSVNAMIGANRMHRTTRSMSGSTNGGLVAPGVYNLANGQEKPDVSNSRTRKEINSVFGSLSLGWNKMAFIDFTARNDWSSTLPKDDNSYFYPSVSGSFVFSELMHDQDWLTFAKLRGGYSQVRNDTDPYQLINTFGQAAIGGGNFLGTPALVNSTTKLNADLKPEKVSSWEIGLEGAFLHNRISFDVTYYNKLTEDLIMPVEIDKATGFSSTFRNAGKMRNRGIEAMVTFVPVKNEDWEWDLTWNFAANDNKLISLYGDLGSLRLGTAPFNVTLDAIVGEEYGQIRGTDFQRDDEGHKIVDANGNYLATGVKSLGSVLPDYNMGIRNTVSYRNFSFSALIDVQHGGKYWSNTNMWDHYTGFHKETAVGDIRENGIVPDDAVLADGTPFTDKVNAHNYFTQWFTGPDAVNVFDASYVKLREVTLSYEFPKKWIGPLAGLQLSVFGRNLAAWGLDNRDFDPEMSATGSGNVQGFEGGSLPPTRSYGMNLKIDF